MTGLERLIVRTLVLKPRPRPQPEPVRNPA